jgi:hypothetical protein
MLEINLFATFGAIAIMLGLSWLSVEGDKLKPANTHYITTTDAIGGVELSGGLIVLGVVILILAFTCPQALHYYVFGL